MKREEKVLTSLDLLKDMVFPACKHWHRLDFLPLSQNLIL